MRIPDLYKRPFSFVSERAMKASAETLSVPYVDRAVRSQVCRARIRLNAA